MMENLPERSLTWLPDFQGLTFVAITRFPGDRPPHEVGEINAKEQGLERSLSRRANVTTTLNMG